MLLAGDGEQEWSREREPRRRETRDGPLRAWLLCLLSSDAGPALSQICTGPFSYTIQDSFSHAHLWDSPKYWTTGNIYFINFNKLQQNIWEALKPVIYEGIFLRGRRGRGEEGRGRDNYQFKTLNLLESWDDTHAHTFLCTLFHWECIQIPASRRRQTILTQRDKVRKRKKERKRERKKSERRFIEHPLLVLIPRQSFFQPFEGVTSAHTHTHTQLDPIEFRYIYYQLLGGGLQSHIMTVLSCPASFWWFNGAMLYLEWWINLHPFSRFNAHQVHQLVKSLLNWECEYDTWQCIALFSSPASVCVIWFD